MSMYSKSQYEILGERFNKQTFLSKLVTIKNNPSLFFIETDGYNVRLRLCDNEAMENGYDSYFSFPAFLSFEHLRDILSLIDIKTKKL